MSNVSSSVTTTARYKWTIPCPWPTGGEVKDLHLAIHWAEREAKEHGIDTSFDNWLQILAEDERIVLYFDADTKTELT